ncbi:MAG: hypothetical protein HYT72_05320 [Candidatus Aenigmarchaeota archaeon]|nr:hypothetical protein [Candidatus Aenigmarchaeota archaeon]
MPAETTEKEKPKVFAYVPERLYSGLDFPSAAVHLSHPDRLTGREKDCLAELLLRPTWLQKAA